MVIVICGNVGIINMQFILDLLGHRDWFVISIIILGTVVGWLYGNFVAVLA